MSDLTLNVKKEYFNQIKSGEKTEEYRLIKPYWTKRLVDREYDYLIIKMGYPKSDDTNRILKFKYSGYIKKKIIHKEFGNKEVEVYAIKIKKEN